MVQRYSHLVPLSTCGMRGLERLVGRVPERELAL